MTPLPIQLVGAAPIDVVAPPIPDDLLVQAVLDGGSEAAFVTLYQRHTERLFRLVRRLLVSDADAEDAVQETWLRAVPRLDTFQWRSSLSTWLGAIAINVAREQLDRGGRWASVELSDNLAAPQTPDADIDLERAIALLPPAARAAFVLHDIEGFTHGDIGRQLGWNPGTSRSQLFRARRMLRRLLGGAADQEHGA